MKERIAAVGPEVALVGPFPPPYGGVSVHIQRLFFRLKSEGIPVTLHTPATNDETDAAKLRDGAIVVRRAWWGRKYFQYWGHSWLVHHAWRCTGRVIHCHELFDLAPHIWMICAIGKRAVVTVHDQLIGQRWDRARLLEQISAQRLLKSSCVRWIAVSSVIKEQLVEVKEVAGLG